MMDRAHFLIYSRGSKLANALIGLGLKPGDHVAALLEDTASAFEVYVGCAIGGFPIVHVNDRLVSREVDFILNDSDSKVLIHTDGRSATIETLESTSELRAVITIGKIDQKEPKTIRLCWKKLLRRLQRIDGLVRI